MQCECSVSPHPAFGHPLPIRWGEGRVRALLFPAWSRHCKVKKCQGPTLALKLEFVEFFDKHRAFDQLRVFAGFHDAP